MKKCPIVPRAEMSNEKVKAGEVERICNSSGKDYSLQLEEDHDSKIRPSVRRFVRQIRGRSLDENTDSSSKISKSVAHEQQQIGQVESVTAVRNHSKQFYSKKKMRPIIPSAEISNEKVDKMVESFLDGIAKICKEAGIEDKKKILRSIEGKIVSSIHGRLMKIEKSLEKSKSGEILRHFEIPVHLEQSEFKDSIRVENSRKMRKNKISSKTKTTSKKTDNVFKFQMVEHNRKKVGTLVCTFCKKTFKRERDLNDHIRTHTGEKPYKCPQCGKEFAHKSSLNSHQLTHSKLKKHGCTKCDKMFAQKTGLKIHLFSHLSRKAREKAKKLRKYECYFCYKKFRAPSALNEHLMSHIGGEMSHKCPRCNRRFWVIGDLLKHAKSKHSLITTSKEIDNNTVARLKYKDQKRRNAASELVCRFCNKNFNWKPNLTRHILTHTKEKPHECSQCNKRFTLKSSLNDHLLIHFGVKEHKCTKCNKMFTQERNMKAHLFVHLDEKSQEKVRKLWKNQCYFCHMKFRIPFHLFRHLLTHTKEKTF